MSSNTSSAGRLLVVDAVRALALFGVLVMNLRSMSGIEFLPADVRAALLGPGDRAVELALQVLLDEKSLSGFSFLFGLSFTLLLERRAGSGFAALYARRLLALAAFGVVNIAFCYWGDILLTYALLGGLLLPALYLPQRLLLALAGLLLLGGPVVLAALGTAAGDVAGQRLTDVQALAAFGADSYWRAVAFGFVRYGAAAGSADPVAYWDTLNTLGLFLLGLWTGRAGIARHLGEHRRLLRRVVSVGLPLGLLAALAWALVPAGSRLSTLLLVNAPVLALAYLAGAALLLQRPGVAPARRLLAAPGRMALTNYLLYGLIGQVLFYGWALGLIGQVGTAAVLGFAIITYGFLAVISRAWLVRYRMGPAEWLWRCLTYLEWQPLRRAQTPSEATAG